MANNDEALRRLQEQMRDAFSFVSVPSEGALPVPDTTPPPGAVVLAPPPGVGNHPSGITSQRPTPLGRLSIGVDRVGLRGGVGGISGLGSVASGGISGISGIGGGGGSVVPSPVPPMRASGAAGGGGGHVSIYGKRSNYYDIAVECYGPIDKAAVGKVGGLCFGRIGKKGKVCFEHVEAGRNHCGIQKHGKNKHEPSFDRGFFVPCKPAQITSLGKVGYSEPSISEDDLSPEGVIKFKGSPNASTPPRHTSQEWCVLIEEAMAARDMKADDTDSSESSGEDGVFEDLQPATVYTSTHSFARLPKKVDFTSKVPDGDNALAETQKVLNELVNNLHDVAIAVPLEGEKAGNHLVPVVEELVVEMNKVNKILTNLGSVMGDYDRITGEGFTDIVEAILTKSANGSLTPQQQEALKDLAVTVDDMASALEEFDKKLPLMASLEHVNATVFAAITPLGNSITAMLTRLTQLEGGGVVPTSHSGATVVAGPGGGNVTSPPQNTVSLDTWLTDSHGNQVMKLGDMLEGHRKLVAKVASLEASVSDQGGVVFGKHSFTSEKALRTFLLTHAPTLDVPGFCAFCDAGSYFSYDKEENDATPAHQMLLKMGVDDASARNYINSFKRRYPPAYTMGVAVPKIKPGSKIGCLESRIGWTGTGGNQGQRQHIRESITSSKMLGDQFAKDHVPDGDALELAKDMVAASQTFHTDLLSHMEDQMTILVDSGIPIDDVLALLTEQFALLFDRMYAFRQLSLNYTRSVDVWDWGVRAVWVSLQAIQVQEEAAKFGLSQDPGMGIVFVHFLTKQTGKKMASMLGGGVDDVSKIAKAARDTANAAKTSAATAEAAAQTAHNRMNTFLDLNPDLTKPTGDKSPKRGKK